MYGCKMPEDQNEKTCYKIQVTEVCSLLLIISPGMIVALIAEMRRSSTREMLVPADEILPPGYAEYLKRVLAANEYSENVYDMAVEQFRRLEVEQSLCYSFLTCFSKVWRGFCVRNSFRIFTVKVSLFFAPLSECISSAVIYLNKRME